MYPAKKPLRFVKNVVFLRAVFSQILCEISPFALFLSKNNKSKNTMYSAKKPLRFSENCRFFAGGFSWYSYWNITLSPCFGQKTSKKTPHPLGVFASFWPWILLLKLILLITDENRFLGLGIFLGNSLRLAKIKPPPPWGGGGFSRNLCTV